MKTPISRIEPHAIFINYSRICSRPMFRFNGKSWKEDKFVVIPMVVN